MSQFQASWRRFAAWCVWGAAAGAALGQESKAPFDVAQWIGGSTHQFRGMGDVDGDGDVDLLSYFNGFLVQLQNDGAGGFAPGAALTLPIAGVTPVYPSPFATRDLNADGRTDFVAGWGHLVGGFLTSATGAAPTPIWSISESGVVNALVADDFDGDGYVDVATLVGATVRMWRGTSTGHVSAGFDVLPVYVNSANGQPDVLRTADFDGDGLKEIVAVGSTFGFTPILHARIYGVAGGALVAKSLIQFSASGPSNVGPMPSAGDVDGDGDADLVLWSMPNAGPAGYTLLRGDGAGGFVADPFAVGGPATQLADFDGDGDLDGICCGGGGGPAANQAPSIFEIALNDGTGAFAPAFRFPGVGSAGVVGAEDLDGDGDRDLVAGVAVFWNRGTIPAVSGAPFGVLPATSGTMRKRYVGDLDGDGDLDYFQGPFLPIQWNDGAGTFAPGGAFVATAPAGLAYDFAAWVMLDVDGDRAMDFLVRTRNATTGAVVGTRVLLNQGGGQVADAGFAAGAVDVASWTAPGGVVGSWAFNPEKTLDADFDGDGDRDLLTWGPPVPATPGTNIVARLWSNQGGGAFASAATWTNFDPVAVVDVDADGLPDLVGYYLQNAAFASTATAICRNVGGVFGAPAAADQYLNANPLYISHPITVADLDADGDLDLVRGVDVPLLNDGTGYFTPGPSLNVVPAGFSMVAVSALDLDGDGAAEAIFGTPGLQNYAVVGRISPAHPYVMRTLFVAGSGAFDVLADWDGDGDPDLAKAFVRSAVFHGANAGARRQYGAGVAGTGGLAPIIGVTGAAREGLSGELLIAGGRGGATGLLALGTTPLSLPLLGGTLYLDPQIIVPVTLSGAPGVPGRGTFTLPWTLPTGVGGFTLLHQAAFDDPGAPGAVSMTQALSVTYGW